MGKLKDLAEKSFSKDPIFKGMQWIPVQLQSIHLGGNLNFDTGQNIDIRFLYLIISIGVFILLIACLNYINIATARAYNRGRETGILKVSGSSRTDLIIQFVSESILLSFGGLILALLIICLTLPVFNVITERPLTFSMILEGNTLIKVLVLTFLTGVFAGIYPALSLSSKSPLQLIREDIKNLGSKRGSGRIRNLLVVLQYTISIVALICTFIVMHQLNFIKNTDVGFRKENIIIISLKDPGLRIRPEVIINELRENPEIADITTSYYLPHSITSAGFGVWDGKPAEKNISVFKNGLGTNFIDFYDLKIVSGRGFSRDFSADSAESYVINQTAVKMIGWDNPVGKRFSFDGSETGIVIGVVKDFNFQSLHLAVEPLALSLLGGKEFSGTQCISVRVNPGRLHDTRLFIEKKLKKLSPHYLNPVSVLSDEIDAMYSSERKLSIIFIFSTILAVLLTCLGQYSLTSYTTKSRTKEIVIRKVMGLQPSGIMVLLTTDMARWILVSIFIAWPLAYFLMTRWLQNFAVHIRIGAGVFIYSLLITLLISFIAISYHVIKLSRVNPAEKIRISG
jgi:putative ABC transport system permease protein